MKPPYVTTLESDFRDTDRGTAEMTVEERNAAFLDDFFALPTLARQVAYRQATDRERDLIDWAEEAARAAVFGAIETVLTTETERAA